MSLDDTEIDSRISSTRERVDRKSKYYGRLLNWKDGKKWHYGIGLSDNHIFDTGKNLIPFVLDGQPELVVNVHSFTPDQVIGRLEKALHVFKHWNYHKFGWNSEHLARLIATDDPISYNARWLLQDGRHGTAKNDFRQYLSRNAPTLLENNAARRAERRAARRRLLDRKKIAAEAANQERAANYKRALDLFQQANSQADVRRIATLIAMNCESKKDYASAAAYFEISGRYDEAGRIRRTYDVNRPPKLRRLTDTEIVKRCLSACVTVLSAKRDGDSLGSGFFVRKRGYLLTNNHVIEGATTVKVRIDGDRLVDAKVIKSSSTPDVALLKANIEDNSVALLGDSDGVETGEHVCAIGSPEGLEQSFTSGNISNSSRRCLDNNCFQISALINHGNSGGPLFNEMGLVVGINTFVMGTTALDDGARVGSNVQGINFAIKINEAKFLLNEILRFG